MKSHHETGLSGQALAVRAERIDADSWFDQWLAAPCPSATSTWRRRWAALRPRDRDYEPAGQWDRVVLPQATPGRWAPIAMTRSLFHDAEACS